MAALFFNTRVMDVPSVIDISELKHSVADELTKHGFSSVMNNHAETAGNRGDMRLSVVYLFIGGARFYEQVIAAGGNFAATQGAVNEVVHAIDSLNLL